jgi:hypothetical protein
MLVNVRRAFNLNLGNYGNYGGLPVMQVGPGLVDVPDEAARHWYFQANIRSGNITIIEPATEAA